MQLFGLCHIGRVRQNNEDCLRIEPDLNTVIVADGMGGANAGEVASAITVETIVEVRLDSQAILVILA